MSERPTVDVVAPPTADPGLFVDDLLFDWERRHLFDGGWVCVARSEELRTGGDQFAESIGATAILFLRDHDGCLHAFVNVCRHQGTQLLPCGEAVNCDVVVCRGHAWTYGLDGSLLSAPAQESGDIEVDYGANALQPVAVAEELGMVFASAAGAGDVGDHVGELPALLAPFGLERMVVAGWREYEVAANWKVVLASVPGSAAEGSRRLGSGAWAGPAGTSVSAGVFPNLLLEASGERCTTWLLLPKGAGETVVLCDWAFAPSAVDGGVDPAAVVERGDEDNRAAWAGAEELQRRQEAASGSGEPTTDPLPPAVREILLDRYAAAD